MKSWNDFAALRPDLAEPGQALLYQVGVGLVVVGVFVNLASTVHHVRLTRQLASGEYLTGRPSFFAAAVAIFLALVGLAMAVYLLIVR